MGGVDLGHPSQQVASDFTGRANVRIGPVDEETGQDEKERHAGAAQLHGDEPVDGGKQLRFLEWVDLQEHEGVQDEDTQRGPPARAC